MCCAKTGCVATVWGSHTLGSHLLCVTHTLVVLQGVKAEVQLAVHKDDVSQAIMADTSLTALHKTLG
jgi:hypothetical protein